jgi:hypothetical protein
VHPVLRNRRGKQKNVASKHGDDDLFIIERVIGCVRIDLYDIEIHVTLTLTLTVFAAGRRSGSGSMAIRSTSTLSSGRTGIYTTRRGG